MTWSKLNGNTPDKKLYGKVIKFHNILDDNTNVKIGIFISDLNAHIGKGRTGYKSVSVHFSEVEK